jgi:microcystin-dependent protein
MSSYASARAAARATDQRRVVIREVNTEQSFIVGEGRDGQKILLNFDFQQPLVAIPVPGEFWTIVRNDNEWRLDRRMETGDEPVALSDLKPGDRRIHADGDVHIAADHLIFNGVSIMDLIPAGVVIPFAGNVLPVGWDWADGGSVNAVADPSYMRLYNSIGTIHGGTGPDNFKKPDILGRMIVGHGTHTDVATLGATEGVPVLNRTMKHYHAKGSIAVTASGSHQHTFTGTLATITGGAHGHTFTGSAGTTGNQNVLHTHGPGSFTVAAHSHGGGNHSHTFGRQVQSMPAGSVNFSVLGDMSSHDVGTDASGNVIASEAPAVNGGISATESVFHQHAYTPAGGISNTDTHTHSYTPAGGLSLDTHVHTNADFTGNVGTTTGISETSAYIVLNHIIKL